MIIHFKKKYSGFKQICRGGTKINDKIHGYVYIDRYTGIQDNKEEYTYLSGERLSTITQLKSKLAFDIPVKINEGDMTVEAHYYENKSLRNVLFVNRDAKIYAEFGIKGQISRIRSYGAGFGQHGLSFSFVNDLASGQTMLVSVRLFKNGIESVVQLEDQKFLSDNVVLEDGKIMINIMDLILRFGPHIWPNMTIPTVRLACHDKLPNELLSLLDI